MGKTSENKIKLEQLMVIRFISLNQLKTILFFICVHNIVMEFLSMQTISGSSLT